jgi:hypothetical protein
LEEAQVPTVIHAGSGPAPGRFTGPAPVAEVLDRHAALKLIIAHMGSLPQYRQFLELALRYPGVYLDTTMVFTDFTEQAHRCPSDATTQLDELADKVLFGGDYPNIPYPYHHAVESITRLGLDEHWCGKVLHSNVFNLFRHTPNRVLTPQQGDAVRSLMFVAPRQLRFDDVEEPTLVESTDALVRPLAATTCDLDRRTGHTRQYAVPRRTGPPLSR